MNIPYYIQYQFKLSESKCLIEFRAGDLAAATDVNIVRKRAWDATIAGVAFESSDAFLTADILLSKLFLMSMQLS